VAGESGRPETHVELLGLLALETALRAIGQVQWADRGERVATAGRGGHAGTCELDEPVVVDGAGRRNHDVPGRVAVMVKGRDRVDRGARDDFGASDDRAAERIAAERCLPEQIEHLL